MTGALEACRKWRCRLNRDGFGLGKSKAADVQTELESQFERLKPYPAISRDKICISKWEMYPRYEQSQAFKRLK